MKNTTKQVLILNHFTSPDIQQAIIILRNPNPENETKIIREAEQVIDNYLSQHKNLPDRPANAVLAAVIALGMTITALAVYGGFHLISSVI